MESETLKIIITVLFLLLLLLLGAVFYAGLYRMARVYNWNGRRYCYLGCVPVRRENGHFRVKIGERMVDLSRTTDYRICPGSFLPEVQISGDGRIRGGERRYLVIDGGDVYFSGR